MTKRVLRAPFDGVAAIGDLDEGASIDTDTEIARFDDSSVILVEFDLPEALIARIGPGTIVTATTPAAPGERFAGRVVAIDMRIASSSRTVRMRIAFANDDGRLWPGASFIVRPELPGESYPVVPELAVIFSRGSLLVWRAVDGKAEQVRVRMVRRRDGATGCRRYSRDRRHPASDARQGRARPGWAGAGGDMSTPDTGGLPGLSVRRPLLAMVMNLMIVIAGLAALMGVEVRELLDVDRPVVSVRANFPGASPTTVDAEVTSLVEGAVAWVAGVQNVRSSSEEATSACGSSSVPTGIWPKPPPTFTRPSAASFPVCRAASRICSS